MAQHIADELTDARWKVLLTAAQSNRSVVVISTARDGVENAQAIAARDEAEWLARAGLLTPAIVDAVPGVETFAWRLTVLGADVAYLHEDMGMQSVDG
jgi:hypothetical protein